jgi:fructose-bisphosphate aldolase class 1
MATPAMESTVAALIASGKGILAADESFPTIEKRFKALNIASTATVPPFKASILQRAMTTSWKAWQPKQLRSRAT